MAQPTTANTPVDQSAIQERMQKFQKQITNKLLFKFYLLGKLPLGLLAGLKIRELDQAHCAVSVPYKWLTTNPFRSTYFAAQSMAAEMSTGVLAMMAVDAYPHPISMLITGMEADFTKKATKRATFTCKQGSEIFEAIDKAYETGEDQTVVAETVGIQTDGEEVARFRFTWSFKRKEGKNKSG